MVYLDELEKMPEVKNVYNAQLLPGEKVIYTRKVSTMGDENGRLLAGDAKFTMTNKRFLVDVGVGLWEIDIKEEIESIRYIQKKWLVIFNDRFYYIELKQPMTYTDRADVECTLNGFRFYFEWKHSKGVKRFREILEKAFPNEEENYNGQSSTN